MGTAYQLNINIDQTGVSNINSSSQFVTIVKSVTSSLVGGNLPVAWLTFSPLETNVVSWVENYSLYATTQQLSAGATITMTSQSAGTVQSGWVYTFQNGIFSGASGTGSTYNLSNEMSNYSFTFGLAQQASLNGGAPMLAPLNAVGVPYNEQASFTPIESLSIYLSSFSNNGVVISQVAGNALPVTLSSQSPSATIGFNDSNNTFYQAGTALMSSSDFAKQLVSARRVKEYR